MQELSAKPEPPARSNADDASHYQVWAPAPRRVEVEIDGVRHPMRRLTDGWWLGDRRPAHGDRYGYVLDGDGPFPDPRSRSQPSGVHGLSEWIDHGRFAWSDGAWHAPSLASAVIYELHVGTFTAEGTFAAAIEHLPHLIALGVTHVELMPVAQFSGAHGWGYDGVDLFAPHHVYGTPDDLKRLVDACHAAGLAVILDVVYNHLGPSGNYLARYGPYFTTRHTTPWGDAVNLDGPGSDEVRRFFCDNARMWLRDYHMDGLRLDAVHALLDTSATHFLAQLAGEVDALEAATGRHYVLIAESDLNDPQVVHPRQAGGFGFDAHWSDDFHHALHTVITGERAGYYEDFGRLEQLARALREGYVYAGDYSRHRGRPHGRRFDLTDGRRLVVATQTHDQVGNRAMGERLVHLTTPGRAMIGAALLLTSPFVPMLFQGEEWAASTPFLYFSAHEDPALAAAVSAGRRREFAAFPWEEHRVPDPQAPDTFERSRLVWDELSRAPHAGMLSWYQTLLTLRRVRPELRNGWLGDVHVEMSEQDQWLAMRRGRLLVVAAFGPDALFQVGEAHLLLASGPGAAIQADLLAVPGESVAIVDLDRDDTSPRAVG